MTPHTTLSSRTGRAAHAALLAGITLMAALIIEATSARAGDLVVRYDQSQLLRLPRPVNEVIIGNPSIADVTIQGGDLLVVTGKSFGVTNIIALDAERNVVQDQRVIVQRDDQRVVTLHRGSVRNSFTCTPACSPSLIVGDDPAYFEVIHKSSEKKAKFSDASAENSAGGGGQ
jgi:hypothetical protein